MRILDRGALVGLMLLCAAMPAAGQASGQQENNIPYGTRAGEFLLLPVGGRGTAMASSFDPLADDVTSMFWNPAGLSLMTAPGAEVSRMNYVDNTNFTWAGIGVPIRGGEAAVGFSLGVFSFANQPEYTVEQPDGTGRTYSVSDTYLGLTYSQQFNDRFSFGITGKYISEHLAGANAATGAADFGANYHTKLGGRAIRGSFVVMNVGGTLTHSGTVLDTSLTAPNPTGSDVSGSNSAVQYKSKGFELPATFRVGIAYDLLSVGSGRLTATGQFIQPTGADVTGAVGAEYNLDKVGSSKFRAALRGGWNLQTDKGLDVAGSTMNGAQNAGLAFGLGLGYRLSTTSDIGFDYAWRDSGLLGNQNLLSVRVHW